MANQSVAFSLCLRGRNVWLRPGQELFIGRSAACHIVLEHPIVSRKHARISADETGAVLTDLSANGTYVNGESVGREPRRLKAGDRIQVGPEEIELQVVTEDVARDSGPTRHTRALSSRVPALSGSEDRTSRADAFAVIGVAADRALADGRVEQAEKLLAGHLRKHATELRQGMTDPPELHHTALRYALKLAVATRNGQWADFAIELLTQLREPPPDDLLPTLEQVIVRTKGAVLRRYLDTLTSSAELYDAATLRRVFRVRELASGSRR